MAFRAVFKPRVELRAVVDSVQSSAPTSVFVQAVLESYVKPATTITYRYLQAADIALDAYSLNRRFVHTLSFTHQTIFDFTKELVSTVEFESTPAISTNRPLESSTSFDSDTALASSKVASSDFDFSDDVFVEAIYNRDFESLASFDSDVFLAPTKGLSSDFDFSDDVLVETLFNRAFGSATSFDSDTALASAKVANSDFDFSDDVFVEALFNREFGSSASFDSDVFLAPTKGLSSDFDISDDVLLETLFNREFSSGYSISDDVSLIVTFNRAFQSGASLQSDTEFDYSKLTTSDYSLVDVPSISSSRPADSDFDFTDSDTKSFDKAAATGITIRLELLTLDELTTLTILAFQYPGYRDDWDFDQEIKDAIGNINPNGQDDAALVIEHVKTRIGEGNEFTEWMNTELSELLNPYYYPNVYEANNGTLIESLASDLHRAGKQVLVDEQEFTTEKPISSETSLQDDQGIFAEKPVSSSYSISDDFQKSVQYSRTLASAFTLDDLLTAGVDDLEKYTEADKGNIFSFESKATFDTSYKFDSPITLGSSPSLYSPRDMSSGSSLESTQAQHFYKEINPAPGVINLASLDVRQLVDARIFSTGVYSYSWMNAFDFNQDGANTYDDRTFLENWVNSNLNPAELEQWNSFIDLVEETPTFLSNLFLELNWEGGYEGDPIWFEDNFDRTVSYSRSFEGDFDFTDSDEKTVGKVVESSTGLDDATEFAVGTALSTTLESFDSSDAKHFDINPTLLPFHDTDHPLFFGALERTDQELAEIRAFVMADHLRTSVGLPTLVPPKYQSFDWGHADDYSAVSLWFDELQDIIGAERWVGLPAIYPDQATIPPFVQDIFDGKYDGDPISLGSDISLANSVASGSAIGFISSDEISINKPLESNNFSFTSDTAFSLGQALDSPFSFVSTSTKHLNANINDASQVSFQDEVAIIKTVFPAGTSSPNNTAFNASTFN